MSDPLIALVGGDEFRPQASVADSYLLGRIGQPARVAILPTAAAHESPALAAENGVRYFRGLGADAFAIMIVDKVSADDPALVDQVSDVDLVYLTGGNPRHLLDSLRYSLLWQRLSAMLPERCAIAGSSAGAMVLGQEMYFRGDWQDALSLVQRVCVLPHFERSDMYGGDSQRSLFREGLTLLGIDSATACIGFGSEWEVVGASAVTVIRRGGSEVYRSGQRLTLP